MQRRKAHTQVPVNLRTLRQTTVPTTNVLDLKSLAEEKRAAEMATLEQPKRRSFWNWLFRRESLAPKDAQESRGAEVDEPVVAPVASHVEKPYFITYDENEDEDASEGASEEVRANDQRPEPSPSPVVQPQQAQEIFATRAADEKSLLPSGEVPLLARRILPTVASFAAVCGMIILPIWGYGVYKDAESARQEVLGVSQSAIANLTNAGASLRLLDAASANQEFTSALENFERANETIREFGALVDVLPVSEISSGKHLLSGATSIAQAGQYLSQSLDGLRGGENQSFTKTVRDANDSLVLMRGALLSATEELGKVDASDIPPSYAEQFQEFQNHLPELTSEISYVVDVADVLLSVLGSKSEQHYLVIFQNPAELRATGGFIGSFAAVTLDQGELSEFVVPSGGTYDVSGQQVQRLIPPAPLGLVSDRFEIQDANWSADFSWSARKIQQMYQDGGGATTDGVIAVDTEVLRTFLQLTGDVELPEYSVTVTSENVTDVLMRQIQEVRDTSDGPKQIIADLVERVLDRALNLEPDQSLDVLLAFNRLLSERHLLLYHRDAELQKQLSDIGWTGELNDIPDSDYLHLNFTNIAGGKTDEFVDTRAHLESELDADGSVTHRLTITRAHKGDPNDELYGINNMSYVRLYVPENVELLEASGFTQIDPRKFLYPASGAIDDPDLETLEGDATVHRDSGTAIHQELGKTVFGNWIETPVGESRSVEFVYRVPNVAKTSGRLNASTTYRLYAQSQPGSTHVELDGTLKDAAQRTVRFRYPESAAKDPNPLWNFEMRWVRDAMFAVILEE